MRTLAVLLVSFALACASAPAPAPPVNERVAVVVEYAGTIKPLDRHSRTYELIAAQVHAVAVVARLSQIDERDYDAVIVLRRSLGLLEQRDYDVDSTTTSRQLTYSIAYDIRREGAIVRSGSLTVNFPDYEPRAAAGAIPAVRNMAQLLRDLH